MSLHDRLLASLESVAGVSLVAKLRDSRLDLADDDRLNVFVPDIHLVTPRRKYNFGTNAPELLTAVLSRLRDLRTAVRPSRLVVYQLGDLLDLWRETDGRDPNADVAAAIEDAHPALVEALYDPALDAHFVLGNHDFELYRWPNYGVWQRSFRFAPAALALHGDILDQLEKMPDRLQNLMVYLFSPGVKPGRAQLETMRRMTAPRALPIGPSTRPAGIADRDRFNVQDAQSRPEMLRFLDSARRLDTALTTVVIGHTHHARIAVHEEGGSLFALVDCGAWIENCVMEHDSGPRPNAQIAAVGANEIRIYQLAPPP